MKVGTDAVVLGCWTEVSDDMTEILDIGTGSGILTLMMAQRNTNARLTALEIDSAAAQQAQKNFNNSIWRDRITLRNIAFQDYRADRLYDLIICNPPFFTHSLHTPTAQRTTARHDDSLPLSFLIHRASEMLQRDGSLSLILPIDREEEVKKHIEDNQLYINRLCRVRGSKNKPYKRLMINIQREKTAYQEEELVLTENGHRTEQYNDLTEDFYLYRQ